MDLRRSSRYPPREPRTPRTRTRSRAGGTRSSGETSMTTPATTPTEENPPPIPVPGSTSGESNSEEVTVKSLLELQEKLNKEEELGIGKDDEDEEVEDDDDEDEDFSLDAEAELEIEDDDEEEEEDTFDFTKADEEVVKIEPLTPKSGRGKNQKRTQEISKVKGMLTETVAAPGPSSSTSTSVAKSRLPLPLPTLSPCPSALVTAIRPPGGLGLDKNEEGKDGRRSTEPKVIKKGDQIMTSYVDEETGRLAVYEVGVCLEVGDKVDETLWYPAKIVEVNPKENEVLVHFENWSSRFDEWIRMDSKRLRPGPKTNVVRTEFEEGERVEALWHTDGQRYPGQIQSVLPNDYYQVLFDDGIRLKKKYNQIFKIKKVVRGRPYGSPSSKSKAMRPPPALTPAPGIQVPSTSTATPKTLGKVLDSVSKPTKSSTKRRSSRGSSFTKSRGRGRKSLVKTENPNSSSLPEKSVPTLPPESPQVVEPDSEEGTTPVAPVERTPIVHYSMFTPITTDLGKRKRTIHDYSMLLKTRQRRSGHALEEAIEQTLADSSGTTPDLQPTQGQSVKKVRGRPGRRRKILDVPVTPDVTQDDESELSDSGAQAEGKTGTGTQEGVKESENEEVAGEIETATVTEANSSLPLDPNAPLQKRKRNVHNYSALLNPKFEEVIVPPVQKGRSTRLSRMKLESVTSTLTSNDSTSKEKASDISKMEPLPDHDSSSFFTDVDSEQKSEVELNKSETGNDVEQTPTSPSKPRKSEVDFIESVYTVEDVKNVVETTKSIIAGKKSLELKGKVTEAVKSEPSTSGSTSADNPKAESPQRRTSGRNRPYDYHHQGYSHIFDYDKMKRDQAKTETRLKYQPGERERQRRLRYEEQMKARNRHFKLDIAKPLLGDLQSLIKEELPGSEGGKSDSSLSFSGGAFGRSNSEDDTSSQSESSSGKTGHDAVGGLTKRPSRMSASSLLGTVLAKSQESALENTDMSLVSPTETVIKCLEEKEVENKSLEALKPGQTSVGSEGGLPQRDVMTTRRRSRSNLEPSSSLGAYWEKTLGPHRKSQFRYGESSSSSTLKSDKFLFPTKMTPDVKVKGASTVSDNEEDSDESALLNKQLSTSTQSSTMPVGQSPPPSTETGENLQPESTRRTLGRPPNKKRKTKKEISKKWKQRKAALLKAKTLEMGGSVPVREKIVRTRKPGHILNGMSAGRLAKIRKKLYENGVRKRIGGEPVFKDVSIDTIRCTCGVTDEHGLMVQCELCQCWQHSHCFGVDNVESMPLYYICELCRSPHLQKDPRRPAFEHEFNKTGNFPKFSFANNVDPEVERVIREGNELLERLHSVQNLLHSTNVKISIHQAVPEHPKIYQWYKPHPTPAEVIQTRNVNKLCVPILRRLFRAHSHDLVNYKAKLREKVMQHLKLKEEMKLKEALASAAETNDENKDEKSIGEMKTHDSTETIVYEVLFDIISKLEDLSGDTQDTGTSGTTTFAPLPTIVVPDSDNVQGMVDTSAQSNSSNEISNALEMDDLSDARFTSIEEDLDAAFNLNPDRLMETIEDLSKVTDDPESSDLLLNIFDDPDFKEPIFPTPQVEHIIPIPETSNSGPAPPERITAELCRANLMKSIQLEQKIIDDLLDEIEKKVEELEAVSAKLKRNHPYDKENMVKLKELMNFLINNMDLLSGTRPPEDAQQPQPAEPNLPI